MENKEIIKKIDRMEREIASIKEKLEKKNTVHPYRYAPIGTIADYKNAKDEDMITCMREDKKTHAIDIHVMKKKALANLILFHENSFYFDAFIQEQDGEHNAHVYYTSNEIFCPNCNNAMSYQETSLYSIQFTCSPCELSVTVPVDEIKEFWMDTAIACTRCKGPFTVEVPPEARHDWICATCSCLPQLPVTYEVKDGGLHTTFTDFLQRVIRHVGDQLGFEITQYGDHDFTKQSAFFNQFFIEFKMDALPLVAIIDLEDVLIPAGGCFEYGAMVYVKRFTITIKERK